MQRSDVGGAARVPRQQPWSATLLPPLSEGCCSGGRALNTAAVEQLVLHGHSYYDKSNDSTPPGRRCHDARTWQGRVLVHRRGIQRNNRGKHVPTATGRASVILSRFYPSHIDHMILVDYCLVELVARIGSTLFEAYHITHAGGRFDPLCLR